MAISPADASIASTVLKATLPTPKARSGSLTGTAGKASFGVEDSLSLSSDAVLRITQEALDSLVGKQLQESFQVEGITLSDQVGIDWSPEATAGRIVDFATGMLGVWKGQNPEMSDEELHDTFEKTIRGAIDTGYLGAMDTLGDMEIGGEYVDLGKATMTRVDELLNSYFSELGGESGDEPESASVSEKSEVA